MQSCGCIRRWRCDRRMADFAEPRRYRTRHEARCRVHCINAKRRTAQDHGAEGLRTSSSSCLTGWFREARLALPFAGRPACRVICCPCSLRASPTSCEFSALSPSRGYSYTVLMILISLTNLISASLQAGGEVRGACAPARRINAMRMTVQPILVAGIAAHNCARPATFTKII